MTGPLAHYAAAATDLAARYDAESSEDILAPVADLLPPPPASVVDIGAGSGRDLAHFAALGHPVAAAEPIAAFRAVLAARLPDATLFDAGLPDLPGIDSRYDLILVNAVWQHLPPEDRTRAFARLAGLLASGGCLALSLRHGPAAPAQGLFPLDAAEETARATAHGLHLVAARPSDLARAPGVTWTWLVLEPETRP